jgi:hypothetical protein
MRKKCVRWTESVRTPLAVAVAIISALVATPSAQSNDPSTLPRLSFQDIQYVGGFRLPSTMSNDEDYSFGGRQLAFNPATNSLYVGNRRGRVAEVSIPGLVNSTNPEAMPFASYLQPFADPTEGRLSELGSDGVAVDGLMVYGNRLYGTAFVYYDANNTQRKSHYSRSLRLNEASFQGWSSVWQADKTGFVSGAMTTVPGEWQSLLGGPAITGQCCIPIVTRTSWGPAAFAFNPAQVGQASVPATPLLYYTGDHSTLGSWDSSNPTYGATISMGGMVIIPGTRTALYFGTNGVGPNCYGNGTPDPSLDGVIGTDGEKYCYDPTSGDKGSHAYPYRYQIWAYDLNDFAEVRAGTRAPWSVVPYGVWPFDLPTAATIWKLGGVGYDAATQTIYLSQLQADKDGYSYRPIIHALRVNGSTSNDPPVTSVTVVSDLPAPQQAATPIRFVANVNDGTSPIEYKWMTYDGTGWTVRADWSTSNQLAITPQAPNPSFRAGVWVRSGNRVADAPEAEAALDFPIASTRVTSVAMSADKTAPQAPGTPIVWTAAAAGGSAAQYKWWVYDGTTWIMVKDWSAAPTYTWTPATAAANYRVSVWSRSGGSTDIYEATNEAYFVIAGATAVAKPPVSVNVPATVQAGAPFTARVADGPGLMGDWLGIYTQGESYDQYRNWNYLNGAWSRPATGLTQANVSMVAPMTAGTYFVRLYENDSTTLRATSAAIVVTPPSLVTASLSGGNINVSIQNPPGDRADWVGLFPIGAADTAYVAWEYLNGSQSLPGSAVANPSFQIGMPVTPGTYELRLFHAGGLSRRATSAQFTVSGATPTVTVNTTSVGPGGTVLASIAGGPAQRGDWAGVFPVGAPANQYRSWSYMNGLAAHPGIGVASTTLGFSMPSTPGTYEIRFYFNDSVTLLATSTHITVSP